MTETHGRDEELGMALRELPVPEHLPTFDQRLRERLEQPRARRFGGLRTYRARLAVAGLTAGAAVAATALVAGLPGESNVATAADVRAAVTQALSSVTSIGGVAVNRDAGGGESRWRFVLDARGDFRITGISHATDLAYDASANVEYYSDGPNFVRRTGIAPGWPDSDASAWVVQRGLASVVRTLASATDASVEEIEYRRRPAWLLRTATGNPGETRQITVDRATAIPVRDVRFFRGRLASEWRIDDLRIGVELSRADFQREPAGGQTENRYDMGFRRTPLEDVRRRVGYDPLVPASLPRGFRLIEVAVAQRSRPTGSEQRPNPPSRNVVSLAYRRGFDELVVTTRLIGADRTQWSDPLIAGILSGRPTAVTLAGGALQGLTGELVVDPNAPPHVWAMTDRLVVTVSGDVDREELLQVAESLRPAS